MKTSTQVRYSGSFSSKQSTGDFCMDASRARFHSTGLHGYPRRAAIRQGPQRLHSVAGSKHMGSGRWPRRKVPAMLAFMAWLHMACVFSQEILPRSAEGNAGPVRGAVVALDPRFEGLVSPSTKLQVIHQQSNALYEGPTWVGGAEGYFIVSNIPGNAILRIGSDKKLTAVVRKVQSGRKEAIFDTLYTRRYLTGPNGTVVAPDGSVVYCVFGDSRLERVNLHTGKRTVIASTYQGQPLRWPNDVTFSGNGDVYFSAAGGLYRLQGGEVRRFAKIQSNGLAFSPHEHFLYATDGASTVLRFTMTPDGSAEAKEVFIKTSGDIAGGPLDGMKVDRYGDVWAVAPGGVWVINPAGQHIGTIRAPRTRVVTGWVERFTNLAFGGRHGATLLLTAPGGIYRLPLARRLVEVRGE